MIHETELNGVLQEIMFRWDVPGLAVGIVCGDEIVYAEGFGVQSLKTHIPVTLDSVFCVQSISKCFVASAAMKLMERGELALDVPIIQYLPYFQMKNESYRHITIRQILSHTSGMPDMEESEYVELVRHPEKDDGALERYIRHLKNRHLIAQPGKHFSYSNIAYNVLGGLLARVSGTSFERTVQELILIPSGMSDSTFTAPDVSNELLAWPHLRSPEMKMNPIYPYHRADAPASFLHTTVVDMCHWCITCLKRGRNRKQNILSADSFNMMWTPVAKRDNPSGLFEEMGLGWTLGHLKGQRTVSHGGAGFGGTAFLLILPERNSAAVVLCNEESNAHFRVIRAVADSIIDQKPQVKSVSWMVPISRALAEGGIESAYAQYAEIKGTSDEFYFREDDLISLSLQLYTANNIDLAIETLGLNIHVYPEYIESYTEQAKLYLLKGEIANAKESLSNALSIESDNATATKLLKEVQ